MRFGPPAPLHSSLLLTGAGPSNGASFVGALDGYTTGMVEVYSPFKKLLATYTGDAIRVRRSSDNSLRWIPFLSTGEWDVSDYLSFIGAGNGFAHTVPGQKNGRDQTQATAAAQPQIGADGNGQYYLYAPGAGSATTSMSITGLSVPAAEFTIWSVAGASGVWFVPLCLRDHAAVKERAMMNYGYSSNAHIQDNATGSVPGLISQTSGLVYSTVLSAGASGSKMTNRLSTTTGTRNASACNIEQIHIGRISGGPTWLQNAPFYCGGVWSTDYGPTANFNALATLGKTLITTAQ